MPPRQKSDKTKMKTKCMFLLAALGLAAATSGRAQTTVLNETFDNNSAFTVSSGFFSDGSGDYLGLVGGTDNFGAGSTPTSIPSFSGVTGSYLVGEDLEGEGASLPITIDWTGLDISGLTNISFSGDFGSSTGGIDLADEFVVRYRIDTGVYTDLINFDFVPDGDNFNNIFRLAGGSSPTDDLGLNLKNFTASIPGTGSTLDIRLVVSLDAGSEEFAVDNFIITAIPEPSSLIMMGLAALAAFGLLRKRK